MGENRQCKTNWEPETKEPTLVEQILGSLVGIHVGLLEHGINIGVGVVTNDLLDGLDGLSDPNRDYLTPAVQPRTQDHLSRDPAGRRSEQPAAAAKP